MIHNETLIRIFWKGPYIPKNVGTEQRNSWVFVPHGTNTEPTPQQEDTASPKDAAPQELLGDESEDYGVYQIYGAHTVYGTHGLLYTGKTDRRTFAKRLKEHAKAYAEEHDITIYVGRLVRMPSETTPPEDEWQEQIDMAEKLLIFFHAPAHNSQNINDPLAGKHPIIKKLKNERVRVRNYGKYHSLIPEMSSDSLYGHVINESVRKCGFDTYSLSR